MSSAVIVVPCYNAAKRIDLEKFRVFSRAGYSQQFLFVDDGSTDGTSRILENLRDHDPQHFAVHVLPKNYGKAEAVRMGLLPAFKTNPDYVGYWDADLATPLDTIPTFCELLDARPDPKMVFGARVLMAGRAVKRSLLRHYLGRVFATATSLTLGFSIYDSQCGAKLFRVLAATISLFQQPFMTRWLLDIEILARLIQTRRGTNLKKVEDVVYEFPLCEWCDVVGSKVKAWDFLRALCELAVIHR